VIPAQKVH